MANRRTTQPMGLPVGPAPEPWTPQSDPLGLQLQQQVRDRQFGNAVQGLQGAIGPLPDPKWDAYFQAASNAGGGKPTEFGLWDQPQKDLTRDPTWAAQVQGGMSSPIQGLMKSQALGTPVDPQYMKRRPNPSNLDQM